jgi:D-beta-D-heptose 7-phosphate kinase/D-beta-D-heptose 1-phosphate adenosyltransferase
MKILTLETLEQWASLCPGLVMTNGCFDILHYGHIRHLVQAKFSGARLLVAVDSDARVRMLKGETRPVNPIERRLYSLAALECVDAVIEFDYLPHLIHLARPQIYTKSGYAWESLAKDERAVIESVRATFRDIPMEPNISTTKILNHGHI